MNMIQISRGSTFVLLLLILSKVELCFAQTSGFTYQGRLSVAGSPANGNYEMRFTLFDALIAGVQIGSPVTSTVVVTNGVFTSNLDFGGSAFNGADRYLELGVRPSGSPNPFTLLTPRQQILSTPYSVRSLNAATSDNSTKLGGVDSTAFVQQDILGNVSIGGTLTAAGTISSDKINAQMQYNLAGSRALAIGSGSNGSLSLGTSSGNPSAASFNTLLGQFAGQANTTGNSNTFVGSLAGLVNTTGGFNSFFGAFAGSNNTTGGSNTFVGVSAGAGCGLPPCPIALTGSLNSYFGAQAGRETTTGDSNAFFGSSSGQQNTTGRENSFFGASSGFSNTTGVANSIFGSQAGGLNDTGSFNSIFGRTAGLSNRGNFNVFFGAGAGEQNTTGNDNTYVGTSAGGANMIGGDNAIFGREAGLNNTNSKNSFFGRSAGKANTAGFQNIFVGFESGLSNQTGNNNTFVGAYTGQANTSAFLNAFYGYRAGYNTTTGCCNSFFGNDAGLQNTTGRSNTFYGGSAGGTNTAGSFNAFFGDLTGNDLLGTGTGNTTGSNNTFFGYQAGRSNTVGSNNTSIGALANVGANNLTNANAVGANALASISNSIVLGSINGVNGATADTKVGIGTTSPVTKLHVNGSSWFQGDNSPLPASAGKGIIIGSAGDIGYISSVDYGTFTPQSLLLNNGGGNVGIGTNLPKATLDVTGGNISVGSPGKGIILKSPNGATCRLLTIDNAGAMVLTAIACP